MTPPPDAVDDGTLLLTRALRDCDLGALKVYHDWVLEHAPAEAAAVAESVADIEALVAGYPNSTYWPMYVRTPLQRHAARLRLRRVLAAEPGPVGLRWLTVRVLASYPTPEALEQAPHEFDVRDAIVDLCNRGEVERLPDYTFRLVRKESPT